MIGYLKTASLQCKEDIGNTIDRSGESVDMERPVIEAARQKMIKHISSYIADKLAKYVRNQGEIEMEQGVSLKQQSFVKGDDIGLSHDISITCIIKPENKK